MELDVSRSYQRDECATFLKTNERFGGLSNMAGGYPLSINGIRILTSEALYQACRFPHKPDIQKLIIGQLSPMTAKMKSKPYRKDSRPDWDEARVQIMYWCLRVKLIQHWEKFGELLLSTGDQPIVEESYRDPFWGAKPTDPKVLIGTNALGQLLTELREELKGPNADALRVIEPPPLAQFLLIGKPVGMIECSGAKSKYMIVSTPAVSSYYEQLTLDAHVAQTTSVLAKAEEASAQEPCDEVLSSSSSTQYKFETTQYPLPLDGLNEVIPPQKLNTKARRRKVS